MCHEKCCAGWKMWLSDIHVANYVPSEWHGWLRWQSLCKLGDHRITYSKTWIQHIDKQNPEIMVILTSLESNSATGIGDPTCSMSAWSKREGETMTDLAYLANMGYSSTHSIIMYHLAIWHTHHPHFWPLFSLLFFLSCVNLGKLWCYPVLLFFVALISTVCIPICGKELKS